VEAISTYAVEAVIMTFARIYSGKNGEDLAVSCLLKQGYKIIERNYRTKLGEIDIIASDRGCVCFIEVRSINTQSVGLPEDTINKKKRAHISRAALSYIKRYRLFDASCRFDVVCIDKAGANVPEIRLVKNAFELDPRYSY